MNKKHTHVNDKLGAKLRAFFSREIEKADRLVCSASDRRADTFGRIANLCIKKAVRAWQCVSVCRSIVHTKSTLMLHDAKIAHMNLHTGSTQEGGTHFV